MSDISYICSGRFRPTGKLSSSQGSGFATRFINLSNSGGIQTKRESCQTQLKIARSCRSWPCTGKKLRKFQRANKHANASPALTGQIATKQCEARYCVSTPFWKATLHVAQHANFGRAKREERTIAFWLQSLQGTV